MRRVQWGRRLAGLGLMLQLGLQPAMAAGQPASAPPTAPTAGAPQAVPPEGDPSGPTPVVSGDAQRLYAQAKEHLLQIRVLTAAGRSQAGVGSGFVIGENGLTVTNYHVVAKLALEPARYVGEILDTGGQRGEFTILALDVLNDLAVLRVKRPQRGHLRLHADPAALVQGQRLFSLGNPLDLGFAISEGSFNGVLARPYYEQILFSGAINPGMSGGPALAGDGKVVGVNVSKRLDGELISFLVPARFVQALLTRAADVPSGTKFDFKREIGSQLVVHQTMMAERLLAQSFATKPLGHYAAPVHESTGVRCWGRQSERSQKPYEVDRLECRMESSLYIDDGLYAGYVNIRHEHISSTRLGSVRFAALYSDAFRNEHFGSHRSKRLTGPQCTESFTRAAAEGAPPLRAVLCVRALREFDNLYEFNLLTATVDRAREGLQSRIDVSGVSYENGLRITRAFLEAIGRSRP
jgi:serine protease Do